MSFREAIKIIYHYKWIIVIILAISLLIGLWLSKPSQSLYEATATLVVKKSTEDFLYVKNYSADLSLVDFATILNDPFLQRSITDNYHTQGVFIIKNSSNSNIIKLSYRDTHRQYVESVLADMINNIIKYSTDLQRNNMQNVVNACETELQNQNEHLADLLKLDNSNDNPDILTTRSVILSLEEQLAAMKIAVSSQHGQIEILEPVKASDTPMKSSRRTIILVAVFWGLVLGIGFAFLLDGYKNNRNRNENT